jgi:hypothetical protein
VCVASAGKRVWMQQRLQQMWADARVSVCLAENAVHPISYVVVLCALTSVELISNAASMQQS